MFQSFNLLARTSALENVELPLLYQHVDAQASGAERVIEALERVGLGTACTTTPASSPAASSSAWRSRARW